MMLKCEDIEVHGHRISVPILVNTKALSVGDELKWVKKPWAAEGKKRAAPKAGDQVKKGRKA